MKKIIMLLTVLIFSRNVLSDDTNIHIDLTPFNGPILPGSPDYGTGEYGRNYDILIPTTNIPNIQVDNK